MKDSYMTTQPITQKWLGKYDFRYSSTYSDKECGEAYYITFPCYFWSAYITLLCEVVVWKDDGRVLVNVFDKGTGGRSKYAPYYLQCSTHKRLLDIIDNNIDKTLIKMGIVNKNEYDTNKSVRKVQSRKSKLRRSKTT